MKTILSIQESAELIKRGVSADRASMVCMDFNGTYAYVCGDEEQTVRYCVNDQFYVEENRVFTLADLLSLLPKEIDVDFPNADGGIDTEDCCLCTQWCINRIFKNEDGGYKGDYTEWLALLGAMKDYEADGSECRAVFWFDN